MTAHIGLCRLFQRHGHQLQAVILAGLLSLTLPVSVLAQSRPEGAAQVALTPAEQAWIASHPVVTLTLDQNNPPLNFRRVDSADDSYSGASIDYLNLVARKTGITLHLVGSTWSEALRKAMEHEVDGVPGARDLPERRARLNFTTPYLEFPIAMVTRSGHAEVRTLGEFAGQRVAVVKNTVRIPVIRSRCPTCTVVEVDSPKDGMAQVGTGGADGFFDDLPVVQRAMGEREGQFKIALLYYYSEAATVRVALRNDAPELLSIFNKGLAAISADEHALIRARWLAPATGIAVQRDLPLSDTQRTWLAAHPVIRVAVNPTRAPIERRDADGKFSGISVDYLHRIEEMLGVRFELVVTDGLDKLQQSGADVISSLSATPDRQQFYRFTEPYVVTPGVVFAPGGSHVSGGLPGLMGKRVGVLAGSVIAETLHRDWPGIEAVAVRNTDEAVTLMRRNEIAAFVGALLTTSHQLLEAGADDIRVVGETDINYLIGMGVRRDWPELLGILDQALAAISKPERDAIRQKWSTIQFVKETDYRPIIALVIAVLVAVVFIVQLRLMVKRRTAQLLAEVAVRRAREAEIQQINEALELRVEQRTAELQNANADLRLAVDQLVQTEKLASLGRLVAGVAHELNTPLGNTLTVATTLQSKVSLFASLMADGNVRRSSVDQFVDECQQASDIIERNSVRAASLIQNFKEIAVDQASVRRRTFHLRRLVEEVCSTHENAWKKTPHTIALEIDASIALDSFPGPLVQVLSNLLENTLVHGFTNAHAGQVRIVARLAGERVVLVYSDDGVGIQAQHLGKIFDPFFTTRIGKGGSGLGLYVVHTLVTGVLGGSVSVHSGPGPGMQVQITLPLVAPDFQGAHTAAFQEAAAYAGL